MDTIQQRLMYWAISIFSILVLFGSSLQIAHAQNAKDAVCAGLGASVGATGNDCTDPEGSTTLDGTVRSVVDILSLVVGAVSVIMVIVGGMKYVTSQGESSGTASAKNTVIYAMVGLVIVALSQILVRFVITRTTDETANSTTTQTTTSGGTTVNNGGNPTQPVIPAGVR